MVSKAYWNILNRLVYNKKISAIPHLLCDGNFISDFVRKQTFLITTLHKYVHQ